MNDAAEDIQSVLVAACFAVSGMAPKFLPYLLAALFFCTLAIDIRRRTLPRPAAMMKLPLISSLCFAIFAVMSAAWSVDPGFSFFSSGYVVLLVSMTAYVSWSLARAVVGMSHERRTRFLRSVPIGGLLALSFLLMETLTSSLVTRTAIDMFPGLVGERGKGVLLDGDRGVELQGFFLNRNVSAAILLLPAMITCSRIWFADRDALGQRIAIGALVVLAAVSAFASDSDTAKVGLVVLLLVLLVPPHWFQKTFKLLAIGIAALVLTAPLWARAPYAMGLHRVEQLPFGFRERISIWEASGRYVLKQPVLGIGANTTRFHRLDSGGQVGARDLHGRHLGWHAHNVYLQTWVELGAVGSLLLAIFLAGLVRGAVRADAPLWQVTGRMAALASVLVCAATGWGLWQPWFLATLALLFVAFQMAAAALSDDKDAKLSKTRL